jgi:hypothetical protein
MLLPRGDSCACAHAWCHAPRLHADAAAAASPGAPVTTAKSSASGAAAARVKLDPRDLLVLLPQRVLVAPAPTSDDRARDPDRTAVPDAEPDAEDHGLLPDDGEDRGSLADNDEDHAALHDADAHGGGRSAPTSPHAALADELRESADRVVSSVTFAFSPEAHTHDQTPTHL